MTTEAMDLSQRSIATCQASYLTYLSIDSRQVDLTTTPRFKLF